VFSEIEDGDQGSDKDNKSDIPILEDLDIEVEQEEEPTMRPTNSESLMKTAL